MTNEQIITTISAKVQDFFNREIIGKRNNSKTRESIVVEVTKILAEYIESDMIQTVKKMIIDDTNNPSELIQNGGIRIDIYVISKDGKEYQITSGIRESSYIDIPMSSDTVIIKRDKESGDFESVETFKTSSNLDSWVDKRDALIASAFTTNFKNDNIVVSQTFQQLYHTIDKFDINKFDHYKESDEILGFTVNYKDDVNNFLLSEIIADFEVYKELDQLLFDSGVETEDEISLNSVIYYMEELLKQTVKFDKKRNKFYVDFC